MIYNISKPSFQLSKFIKHYWAMESCVAEGVEHIQRIVPSGLTELVFYFGDKPEPVERDKKHNDSTLITGQLNNFYDLRITGRLSLFSIIFQPHGLSAFLDIPLQELYNQNVPLRFIFKDKVNELEYRLVEVESFAERIKIVESYFFNVLRAKENNLSLNRVHDSVGLISRLKGNVSVDDLAYDACLSRKQFERTFSHVIGTTPKQFLKIIRFQNAIALKSKNLNTNLTELTYQCGYYDQAHMINDFK
ncbi:MAG TPA: helix-turn-helix domain-containing protein, partial [Prolixibacteraceae bacterium]|nr:helix-turn-helix domain-containing protein [Prolixibacteraceae bacterium]